MMKEYLPHFSPPSALSRRKLKLSLLLSLRKAERGVSTSPRISV